MGIDSHSTPWVRVVAIAAGLTVVIGVLVTAFGWPAIRSEPNDIPLAVAGPPEVVAQVTERLDEAKPGGFEVLPVGDQAAARDAILDREAYGAIILEPGATTVLTASAASPVVAQALGQLAAALGAADGSAPDSAPQAPAVEDVVALPAEDPRGVGLAAAAFPMAIGGMAIGGIAALAIRGSARRVATALLAAAGGGVVTALVTQTWLGSLAGDFWANAGVVGLVMAAVSLTVVGLVSVFREAGIAIAALLFIVLGNPLSGLSSAPEMLPAGWGEIGQWLPLGAGGSLLRSTAYFDGAAAGFPVLVLLGWIALGLLMIGVGTTVGTRSRAVPAVGEPEPAAVR
jgi:hypothetical protein